MPLPGRGGLTFLHEEVVDGDAAHGGADADGGIEVVVVDLVFVAKFAIDEDAHAAGGDFPDNGVPFVGADEAGAGGGEPVAGMRVVDAEAVGVAFPVQDDAAGIAVEEAEIEAVGFGAGPDGEGWLEGFASHEAAADIGFGGPEGEAIGPGGEPDILFRDHGGEEVAREGRVIADGDGDGQGRLRSLEAELVERTGTGGETDAGKAFDAAVIGGVMKAGFAINAEEHAAGGDLPEQVVPFIGGKEAQAGNRGGIGIAGVADAEFVRIVFPIEDDLGQAEIEAEFGGGGEPDAGVEGEGRGEQLGILEPVAAIAGGIGMFDGEVVEGGEKVLGEGIDAAGRAGGAGRGRSRRGERGGGRRSRLGMAGGPGPKNGGNGENNHHAAKQPAGVAKAGLGGDIRRRRRVGRDGGFGGFGRISRINRISRGSWGGRRGFGGSRREFDAVALLKDVGEEVLVGQVDFVELLGGLGLLGFIAGMAEGMPDADQTLVGGLDIVDGGTVGHAQDPAAAGDFIHGHLIWAGGRKKQTHSKHCRCLGTAGGLP